MQSTTYEITEPLYMEETKFPGFHQPEKCCRKTDLPYGRKFQDKVNWKRYAKYETSSSSSSSSESEEEYEQTDLQSKTPLTPSRRQLQQTAPTSTKWSFTVDFEGFISQQVTAKMNPKLRILVIKAKLSLNDIRLFKKQVKNVSCQLKNNKIIRGVYLPENIYLDQVQVQLTSCGQVIVKAPFVLPNELAAYHERHFPSIWMPIHVTEYFVPKQGNADTLKYAAYPYKRETNQFSQTHRLNRCDEDFPSYRRFANYNKYFNDFSDMIHPEYIRDTLSGKLAMIIKVNTVGFLPREINVRVNQDKRILIVEADIKKSVERREMMSQQEQGVPVKYFRREFVLPQWIDVTHIGYYVLQNGLLTFKLPIVKSQQNKYIAEVSNMLTGQLKNIDWVSPIFV